MPALDLTTPATADTVPSWFPVPRSTRVDGLALPAGYFFYIRFSSQDAGGVLSRDEIGVDKIVVTFPDVLFADGFEA